MERDHPHVLCTDDKGVNVLLWLLLIAVCLGVWEDTVEKEAYSCSEGVHLIISFSPDLLLIVSWSLSLTHTNSHQLTHTHLTHRRLQHKLVARIRSREHLLRTWHSRTSGTVPRFDLAHVPAALRAGGTGVRDASKACRESWNLVLVVTVVNFTQYSYQSECVCQDKVPSNVVLVKH